MGECERCKGGGVLRSDDGEFEICSCVIKEQIEDYISPLMRFRTPNTVNVKPVGLANKSQAVAMTDENMVGLIRFVVKTWYPKLFRVTCMEELNAIGFGRHEEFRSISTLAHNMTNHIIDCGFLNPIRSRNEGFKENDTLYTVELIKYIVAENKDTVIFVLPANPQAFIRDYRELCECLADLGIEYFRNGKYHQFPSSKTKEGDQP